MKKETYHTTPSHRLLRRLSFLVPLAVLAFSCQRAPQGELSVRRIGDTPADDARYAQGVSGMFSGIIDNHLLIAGGANFPDTPAAEGGTKRTYNTIYALSLAHIDSLSPHRPLPWGQVAVLPEKVAYGASAVVSEPSSPLAEPTPPTR